MISPQCNYDINVWRALDEAQRSPPIPTHQDDLPVEMTPAGRLSSPSLALELEFSSSGKD